MAIVLEVFIAEKLHEDIFGVTLDQSLFQTPAPFSSGSPPAHCTIVLAENGGQLPDVSPSDLVKSFEALGLSTGGMGNSPPYAPTAAPLPSGGKVEGAQDVLCDHVHQQVAQEASSSLPPAVQPPDTQLTNPNKITCAALDASRPNSPLLIIAHEDTNSAAAYRPILGLEIPFGALPELTLFNCVTALVRPVLF